MTGDSKQIEDATGYDALASREKLLVAYPTGLDRNWNMGQAGAYEKQAGLQDDVKFLVGVVDDLARDGAVDRARVYLTGHSNGGRMAYRAGCERADVFAAIVPVSASLVVMCHPTRPLPVLHVHGDADPLVTVGAATFAVDQLRKADGCPARPTVTRLSKVTTTTYKPCRYGSEVIRVIIAGFGHYWPVPQHGYDATGRGWEFMSRHALSEP
jgi:polyhydroxybutyrate depolymerase